MSNERIAGTILGVMILAGVLGSLYLIYARNGWGGLEITLGMMVWFCIGHATGKTKGKKEAL
jgi:hypothetical protein